jgi:hypothetical protein
MNDPKRLSASDDAVERTLLRAGRVIAPPGSKERALMMASGALGASGAVVGGAAASKGTAFGIAKAGSIASLKWFGIVSLTGIGLTASAVVVHEVRESRAPASVDTVVRGDKPTAPKRAPPKLASAPRADEGWTPAPIDPITLSPSSDVLPVPPPPARTAAAATEDAAAPPASTVPTELAMLDQVRGALTAGDPARSLSILERYAERFPHGSMAPEATMLRIEALLKAGDRSAATRFADSFLENEPDSPYAARVRSLLETDP